jgi:hypothetical protein
MAMRKSMGSGGNNFPLSSSESRAAESPIQADKKAMPEHGFQAWLLILTLSF